MTTYTGSDIVYKFSTSDSFGAIINGGFGSSSSSSFEAIIDGYSETPVTSVSDSYSSVVEGWVPKSSFNAIIWGEGIATGPVSLVELSQDGGNTFVDVSEYVIGDGTINKNAFNSIATASINLDIKVEDILSEELKEHDIIRISIGYGGAGSKRFYGLIMNTEEKQNAFIIEAENYAGLPVRRTHTGVYRDDSGTGNCKEIIKTIMVKNLAELNWTDISIPDTTVTLARYAVQNKYINEIFDYIAKLLGRVWWVDDDRKLWMIEREFSQSTGVTATYGSNILGELRINRDTSQWANYVIVDGNTRLIGYTESFTGDGITKIFTLGRVPHQVKVTVDDDVKLGGFEGSFEESTAEYLVDCVNRTITFDTVPTSGSTIVVDHMYLARVHEELQDSVSVNEFQRIDKKLTGEGIESQTEAKTIGQNYLDLYSVPIIIYSCRLPGNDKIEVGKTMGLVHSEKGINETCNVLDYTETFGTNGWTIDLSLNNAKYGFPDMYKDLLLKVKRLEERDRLSNEYIVKYYMYGKKLVVSVTGATLNSVPIMDTMIWAHPSGANSDWGTAKWGDRRSSEVLEAVWT